MRLPFSITVLLTGFLVFAQPQLELTPNGFDPVTVEIPSTPNEKLIEVSTAWANEYNRRQKGAVITDVTANSMTITAYKKNAFYFRNRGEAFDHSVNYTLKLAFSQSNYTLQFTVTDIFTDGDKLIQYKLPDYFRPDGKLKEGYTDLEKSLEDTVNDIVASHYNFLINYR